MRSAEGDITSLTGFTLFLIASLTPPRGSRREQFYVQDVRREPGNQAGFSPYGRPKLVPHTPNKVERVLREAADGFSKVLASLDLQESPSDA